MDVVCFEKASKGQNPFYGFYFYTQKCKKEATNYSTSNNEVKVNNNNLEKQFTVTRKLFIRRLPWSS